MSNLSLLGEVDPKLSAIQGIPVELLNRALGFAIVGHLNESKATRSSGFAVEGKRDRFNRSDLAKKALQITFPNAIG